MYIHTWMCIHAHEYINVHASKFILTCMNRLVRMHVHMFMHTCMYMEAWRCIHVHGYMDVFANKFIACQNVWMIFIAINDFIPMNDVMNGLTCSHAHLYIHVHVCTSMCPCTYMYGVATVSRIDKFTVLLCRISSLFKGSFVKETYDFSLQ